MKVLPLLLLMCACAPGGPDVCALEPAGTLPVRLVRNVPVTVVGVNGNPAALLLDTGADTTLLSLAAARRLKVPVGSRRDAVLGTSGGEAKTNPVVLDTVQFGTAVLPGVDALVGRGLLPPIDGFLGLNVLAGFELDLDVPAGTLTLYRARPPACAGTPPPWTVPFTALLTERDAAGYLFVTAAINGTSVRALLDTGASRTTASRAAALRAGLPPADLLAGPASTTEDPGSPGITVRPRQFRELRVGTDTLDSPVLNVADLPDDAGEAIIGADYLGTRRVWIAPASGSVFIATSIATSIAKADQPRPR